MRTLRPTSVTVIAWIVIICSALSMVSLVGTGPQISDQLGLSKTHYVLVWALSVFDLIFGICMLWPLNWARLGYIVISAIWLIIGLFAFDSRAMIYSWIVGLIVYAFFLVFLFSRKANLYFAGKDQGPEEPTLE